MGYELRTIAYTQHGRLAVKQSQIHIGGTLVAHGARAAGEYNTLNIRG